jgi:hypothetical protein
MSELAMLGLAPGELASGRPYVEREEHPPQWHDEVALWLWHGEPLAATRAAHVPWLRSRRPPPRS